jgi:molybdopterin synthase catalytic subunit
MNEIINKEKDYNQNHNLISNISRITSKEIDLQLILKSFDNGDDVGATVLFIGTVRNYSDNGKVQGMNYEAYLGMAEYRIKEIEKLVCKIWDVKKISIIHRIGDLNVGEPSVAIAISTPHSKDAFEACQFILNKIKQDVPIWKKEKLLDGKTKWVKGKSIKND